MQCNAINQHYKSEISVEVFNVISKELDKTGNVCEILEKYFKFLNKYEKQHAKEFDSKYDGYRDNDQKQKTDFFNKTPNKLKCSSTIHKDKS